MSQEADPALIDELVSLGYSVEQAKDALTQNDGDIDDALDYLFTKGKSKIKKGTAPMSIEDVTVAHSIHTLQSAAPKATPAFALLASGYAERREKGGVPPSSLASIYMGMPPVDAADFLEKKPSAHRKHRKERTKYSKKSATKPSKQHKRDTRVQEERASTSATMKDLNALSDEEQKDELNELKAPGLFDATTAQQPLEATRLDVDAATDHLEFKADGASSVSTKVAALEASEKGDEMCNDVLAFQVSSHHEQKQDTQIASTSKSHREEGSHLTPWLSDHEERHKIQEADIGQQTLEASARKVSHFATADSLLEDPDDISFSTSIPGAYHMCGDVETPVGVDPFHGSESVPVSLSTEVDTEPPTLLLSSQLVSEPPIVFAAPDSFLRHLAQNRKTQIIVLCVAGLVTSLVIILGVTLSRASSSSNEVLPGFFSNVQTFDGETRDGEFGTSLSMSSDGNRLVVGAPGRTDSKLTRGIVQVYERNETTNQWVELGPPVEGNSTDTVGVLSVAELAVRAPLAVALSRDGKTLAIGSPYHDISDKPKRINIGQVELFHFDSSQSWVRLGDPILGTSSHDLFGASLALSEDGAIVAIGSPGSKENTGHVKVYQLNSGSWILRGTEMVGAEPGSLFGNSVTLSKDGKTLGAGGSTLPFENTAGIVVRSFSYFGDWVELGSGIVGRDNLHRTVYLAELSSDGTIFVISNYYVLQAGDPSQDDSEFNESLDVRAFRLNGDVWEPLGLPLHQDLPGEKSGYVVSLSDDGYVIAMGDPGTHGPGGGGDSGHAHIYQFNGEKWLQVGPNVLGLNAGDQFGFSVALSGDGKRFVAGAPFNRGEGFEHGRVQIFEYEA